MYEIYYKDKLGKEFHLGFKNKEEDAEAFRKDSIKLAKIWECENKYSYHVRKVD